MGNGDENFFPPETAANLKAVDLKVLQRGESIMEEIEVFPNTPDWRVYLEVKHPIYDDSGAITGLCGVSTDITDRKIAEREKERLMIELNTRATENESILASQKAVVLSYNLKMNVQHVNRSFLKFMDSTPSAST